MEQFIYFVKSPRPTFMQDITEAEREIIQRHFEYLVRLRDEGTLILAGPCLDAHCGIAVLEVENEDAARAIIDNDPAVREGLFTADLHPFRASILRSDMTR